MSARGKRFRKHLVVLAVLGVVGYVVLRPRYGLVVVLLLEVVVLWLWVLFLMPTRCDFEVKGRGCRRGARGKLGGCHDHARDKRDAIFAAMRMRNPGIAVRLLWKDGAQPGRAVGAAAEPRPPPAGSAANRSQGLFNAVLLLVATTGSVAAVLALLLGS